MPELFEVDTVGLVNWTHTSYVDKRLDTYIKDTESYKRLLSYYPNKLSRHSEKVLAARRRRYKRNIASEIGQIYVLRLTSRNEQFLKVGITSDIDSRIEHLISETHQHYRVEIILLSTRLHWTWLNVLEGLALGDSYMPTTTPFKDFSGKTECLCDEPATLKGLKSIIGITIVRYHQRGFTACSPLYDLPESECQFSTGNLILDF
jgi:hypothetical protein